MDYIWEHYGSAKDDSVAPAAQMTIKAYPNPFSDVLMIDTDSPSKSPIRVSIHNLRGQSLHSYQVPGGQSIVWDGKLADGSQAPAGIYFLKVKQDAATGITKVLRLK